ncbi:ABC transporter ATP-binding protein [Pseudoxanthobacter sp. M-2]|uniref:metal ABC transporter ATP-binding protein n=1 Tax=Pseudoxanthobacter sp. M-2 TaxID=3078754 RepID=UPI0038FC9C31
MVTPASVLLDDVGVAYRQGFAVEGVTGRFEAGSFTALVGPNGGGKSSLVKAIVGAVPLAAGRITVEGAVRRDIAYLPQRADIDVGFPITVADVVALGLWRRKGPFRRMGHESQAAIGAAIAAVGLTGLEQRPVGALSGGQLQRALFARLILQDAPILLLDEPFTGVDARTIEDLLALMRTWHAEGRTLVVALHDLALVRAVAPRTLVLSGRPIVWDDTDTALRIAAERPRAVAAARPAAARWPRWRGRAA